MNNSHLTKLFSVIYLLQFFLNSSAQDTIFSDNFETGNDFKWETQEGWSVILDDLNYVLEGNGHTWALPNPLEYSWNATFEAKFKIIEGGFHFNLLLREGRYFFPISSSSISFIYGEDEISHKEIDLNPEDWNSIKAETDSSSLKLYLNDTLIFEYDDPERSMLTNALAFECLDHIYIDDVNIYFHNPEDYRYKQPSPWIRTGGPLGGIGYDVRIDPSDPDIIYVTDQWSGCHKSVNGGETWTPKNNGISSRFGSTNDGIPIFCLTIDPNDPNTVWCGTLGMRGLYKSNDKAENWILKANGIPDTEGVTFRSFAVEPGNSDVVYCGTEWYDGQTSGKIYKTTDGGENWKEILNSSALVRTIIIDPNNTDIIYAATGIFDRDDIVEEGIWKSTDGGENWFHINNGLTNLTVGDIEMHPTNSNILLAACGRLDGFGGGPNCMVGQILKTTDGGQSWTEKLGGQVGLIYTYIEYDETDPNIVYAAASNMGFFKSINGGETWFETAYNPPYINPGHIISIASHPNKKNWLITNSYGGGVFISEDGANHWRDASDGYTGSEITGLCVSPENPLEVYVVARSSIFKTYSAGNEWQGIGSSRSAFGNVPIGELELRSIAVNPSFPNQLLYGTGLGLHQIFKSTDYGNTWRLVYQTDKDDITAITYSTQRPSRIYAGFTVPGGYQIDRPELFWTTQSSKGIMKSYDEGETWAFTNNGLDPSDLNINCITVDPENEDIVYVGTLNTGIYKSINGGDNWFSSHEGIWSKDIRSIAIDPSNTDVIYAGSQRGGAFKSVNGGETWDPILFGMDPEAAVRSIVIDPNDSEIVYASDWSSGVYRSGDGGKRWAHINDGLRTRAVHKLAISKDGSLLYAGTQGEGVFKLILHEGPSINSDITFANNLKFEVYPNPTNGIFSCKVKTNQSENLMLSLFSLKGQIIETRSFSCNGETSLQNYDISQLGKGIYFLVFYNGRFQESRKVVLY